MRWVVLLMAFFLPALAQEAPPPDLPPEVFRIARELRCPVCQGESAAESNSGVAVEMRRIIAEISCGVYNLPSMSIRTVLLSPFATL